jgi:hypothetical protein
VLGAVTNFLDTLGIGSFAPSIAWIRFRRLVPDRLIPLTLLGGYILPSIVQALIFLALLGVQIDPLLLLLCISAMVGGGIVGVPLAARAPIRLVQGLVGLALLVADLFYSLANLGLMPSGGSATTLPIQRAVVAIAVHFLLGVLLSFGVGNYAPTLAMRSLMGMDPRLAFPIMASAASFSGVAAAGAVDSARQPRLSDRAWPGARRDTGRVGRCSHCQGDADNDTALARRGCRFVCGRHLAPGRDSANARRCKGHRSKRRPRLT